MHSRVEWLNTSCSESTYSVPHFYKLQVRLQNRVPICLSAIPLPESVACLVMKVFRCPRRRTSSDSVEIQSWLVSHGRSGSQAQKCETHDCARGEVYTGFRLLGRNASGKALKLLLSCSLYHGHAQRSLVDTHRATHDTLSFG
jgi:hypothetical protein